MSAIVLVQTRRQSLVNELAKLVPLGIVWLVLVWLAREAILKPRGLTELNYAFAGAFAAPFVWWTWRGIVNRGGTEQPQTKIRFDADGIHYQHRDQVHDMLWTRFTGYRIRYWPGHRIRIEGADGENIEFDFHAFSDDQRETIFNQLARHAMGAA